MTPTALGYAGCLLAIMLNNLAAAVAGGAGGASGCGGGGGTGGVGGGGGAWCIAIVEGDATPSMALRPAAVSLAVNVPAAL